MSRNRVVDGLTLPIFRICLNDSTTTQSCLGCVSGKMQRSSFPVGRTRANEVGQLIHSYVCGPKHVVASSGSRFFMLFTDDYSGWRCVYFLKQISEVPETFKDYTGMVCSGKSHLIHILRSDNSGEFTSHSCKNWLSSKGIHLESSTPHTPKQNGVCKSQSDCR
jgi:hypothetical protein